MKRFSSYLVISSLVLSLLLFLSSCDKDDTSVDQVETAEISSDDLKSGVESWVDCFVETEELSTAEKEMLQNMLEEEKLARDIYSALYETWNVPVFENISLSEQNHINALSALVDFYELETEVNDVPGEFLSDDFTQLYDSLLKEGNISIEKALHVGATIEDLDISDLDEYLTDETNVNLVRVFENLLDGSINHFLTFRWHLAKYDIDYEVQYMDQDLYETIISYSYSNDKGQNNGDGYGNGNGYRNGNNYGTGSSYGKRNGR